MDFKISKKGYDIAEVNEYLNKVEFDYKTRIDELIFKNTELKEKLSEQDRIIENYNAKTNNINEALMVAVETAKQIEDSSKSIYELEIKRLRILYKKWENFLNEMISRYPDLKGKFDSKIILNAFNQSIEKTLENNLKSIENMQKDTPQEKVKSLVNKMSLRQSYRTDDMPIKESETPTIIRNTKPSQTTYNDFKTNQIVNKEQIRIKEANDSAKVLPDNIKPISDITLSDKDKYDSVLDKFLNTDEIEENAYAKAILKEDSLYKPNDSGFNLKEAITPTEDLLDIMKEFDLDKDK